MDWDRVIERNRPMLLRIVMALFAMAGLAEGGGRIATLPRHVRSAIMRILKPAESAVRRLIVIAARKLHFKARPFGEAPLSPIRRPGIAEARPVFQLIDPLKRFAFNRKPYIRPDQRPRITSFDTAPTVAALLAPPAPRWVPPSPHDEVSAKSLCRRLLAIRSALDNIPAQARRLALWKARRDRRLELKPHLSCRLSPIRGGYPPGRRKRHIHEVDDILEDCQALARYAMEQRPDTS